ncbi:hypothetical protein NIES4073_84480 [Kalymmatonema gypsitolerans NIES-4073]|nr:hypothetical protein NIES4073_84480 [Scytonema sp. NIES-4073]
MHHPPIPLIPLTPSLRSEFGEGVRRGSLEPLTRAAERSRTFGEDFGRSAKLSRTLSRAAKPSLHYFLIPLTPCLVSKKTFVCACSHNQELLSYVYEMKTFCTL